MERCLEKKSSQALRLLNNTGISSIPVPTMDGSDNELYNELLHNASILYNETLVTCNKTEFLTVRGNIQEHYKNFLVIIIIIIIIIIQIAAGWRIWTRDLQILNPAP